MRRSPGITVDEPVELEIARMRRRHLKGVMAIERQVYPRPWSPNLFLSEMSELRNRSYLVARMGRELVGYGGIMCYGEEAHVTTIAVEPDYHRRKIGTRILFELVQPVGIRKNYYQETGEDAVVMWVDNVRSRDYFEQLDRIIGQAPDGIRPD